VALTPLKIRHLKPGPSRREIADGHARGLYVIVQPSGRKSFAVRYRLRGKPRKLTLGDDGTISLADARARAAQVFVDLAKGIDPAKLKLTAKIEARAAAQNTLAAVTNEYFEQRRVKELRSSARAKANLQRLALGELGHRPVHEIKRSEIARLIDRIDAKQGPRMADAVLSHLRVVLKWWSRRADDNFVIPIVPGLRERSNTPRQRVLADGELRRVWLTAEQHDDPFAGLIRVLLLTGARLNEAARMTRDEIDGDLWRLPGRRHKLKSDLVRPLSAAAHAIIDKQPRIGNSSFVFGVSGRAALGNFSDRKLRFQKASGTDGWTLHDLRRTARTLLARAGVDREVAERCLGHVRKNIETTYNLHDYQPQMAVAYVNLAALIERIVNPVENVVPMRG
jgi:integrase